MSAFWLKLIGSTENPRRTPYERDYVHFPTKPSGITPGDRLLLYAVGGLKRVFATAEVTSEVHASDEQRWPYRLNVRYEVNVSPVDGVHIDNLSSPRDLLAPIRRGKSYFRITPELYDQADAELRRVRTQDKGRQGIPP